VTSAAIGIAVETSGLAVTMRLIGELDMATAPACERDLSVAVRQIEPPALVVLDLEALRFLGCAGITMLVNVGRLCRRRGLTVCLVAETARLVKKVIRFARVTDELPLCRSVEEAVVTYRWVTGGAGQS